MLLCQYCIFVDLMILYCCECVWVKRKFLILIVTISVLFIATVSFLIIKNKTDKMEKFEINNNENNEENNTENNTKNESKEDNDQK